MFGNLERDWGGRSLRGVARGRFLKSKFAILKQLNFICFYLLFCVRFFDHDAASVCLNRLR